MNDKIQDESVAYFHYFNEFEQVEKKTSMNNNLIVKEDDNGELYIELPDELMEQMGWNEDTELVWTVYDDGKIGLRKKTDDSSTEA
jgi:hypothetical protein